MEKKGGEIIGALADLKQSADDLDKSVTELKMKVSVALCAEGPAEPPKNYPPNLSPLGGDLISIRQSVDTSVMVLQSILRRLEL